MVLAIYGAGGLGRVVLDMVNQIQTIKRRWERVCFVDDALEDGQDKQIHGVPVLRFDTVASQYGPGECQFVIAVGEPDIREKLFHKLKEYGYSLETLVHPSAIVSDSAVLCEGVVVLAMAYLDPDTFIDENTLIQPFSSIGHDTRIGKSAVCAPFAGIAGNVTVGDRTYIAMHAAVHEGKKVGSDTIIGMGSMVQRDIPHNVIAMGNPARPMKYKNDSKVFSAH